MHKKHDLERDELEERLEDMRGKYLEADKERNKVEDDLPRAFSGLTQRKFIMPKRGINPGMRPLKEQRIESQGLPQPHGLIICISCYRFRRTGGIPNGHRCYEL